VVKTCYKSPIRSGKINLLDLFVNTAYPAGLVSAYIYFAQSVCLMSILRKLIGHRGIEIFLILVLVLLVFIFFFILI